MCTSTPTTGAPAGPPACLPEAPCLRRIPGRQQQPGSMLPQKLHACPAGGTHPHNCISSMCCRSSAVPRSLPAGSTLGDRRAAAARPGGHTHPSMRSPFPPACSLKKMVRNEGWVSLYRGVTAPLLGNMVLLGIHFPTFSKTRNWLNEQARRPGGGQPAPGAAGAEVPRPALPAGPCCPCMLRIPPAYRPPPPICPAVPHRQQ